MENERTETKILYREGRRAGLVGMIAFSIVCLGLGTLAALSTRGRSAGQTVVGFALAAAALAGAVFFTVEGVKLWTTRVTLYDDRFAFRIFPKPERTFLYSDCLSWEAVPAGRGGGGPVRLYKLLMKDGSILLVDNYMLREGLGQRIGFFGDNPLAS